MSNANAKEKAAAQQPDSTPGEKAKSTPPATSPAKPQPDVAKPAAAKPVAPADAPKVAAAKPAATETAKPVSKPSTDIKFALVVDDEPANRDFLMRLLEQAKLDVTGASTIQEARDRATAAERLELIVIDHKLPDGDGVDLMVELRALYPHAHMVMATMLDERALMDKAFENGCDVFLVKPHGFMELFRRILSAQASGDTEPLTRMIIDQYGPRPYRG